MGGGKRIFLRKNAHERIDWRVIVWILALSKSHKHLVSLIARRRLLFF